MICVSCPLTVPSVPAFCPFEFTIARSKPADGRLLFCSVSVKVVVEPGATVVDPLRLSDVALDEEVLWHVQPDVVCPEMPVGYAQPDAAERTSSRKKQHAFMVIPPMVKH
jgi:hypothetical protein